MEKPNYSSLAKTLVERILTLAERASGKKLRFGCIGTVDGDFVEEVQDRMSRWVEEALLEAEENGRTLNNKEKKNG